MSYRSLTNSRSVRLAAKERPPRQDKPKKKSKTELEAELKSKEEELSRLGSQLREAFETGAEWQQRWLASQAEIRYQNNFNQAFADTLKEFGTIDRLVEEYSAMKQQSRSKEEELSAEKTRVLMLDAGWRETIRQLRAAEALAQKYREVLQQARKIISGEAFLVTVLTNDKLKHIDKLAEQALKEGA